MKRQNQLVLSLSMGLSAVFTGCPEQIIPPAITPPDSSHSNNGDTNEVLTPDNNYGISKRPNVFYVLLDDAGYGDFGCYGQKYFQTPNIDQIAETGIRFTDGYASAPVSASSRCAMFTGRTTGHAYIRGNAELGSGTGEGNGTVAVEGQKGFPASEYTLAQMFKDNGYYTAMVGKWGMGMPANQSGPLDKGFDYYYGHLCQRMAHTYFPQHVWENDQKVTFSGNNGQTGPIWLHDQFEEKTLEQLEIARQKNQPFFFYAAYTIPHGDLQIPEGKLNDATYHPYTTADWWKKNYTTVALSEKNKKYAVMMHRLDLTIGNIIAKLKELGMYENTLFIITSDNGPANEKGAKPEYFDSNGIYRDWKRATFDGGVRVPLIISWPEKIKTASENSMPVVSYDFMTTFADILNCDLTKKGSNGWKPDGISLLPTLMNDPVNQVEREYIYWEYISGNQTWDFNHKQGVRMGKWKGVLDFGKGGSDVVTAGEGEILLYDIVNDPEEKDNLAGQYPEVVRRIKEIMIEAHEDSVLSEFDRIRKPTSVQ